MKVIKVPPVQLTKVPKKVVREKVVEADTSVDVAAEATADVKKLSVEEQIEFWKKMSADESVTGSARITAYSNLVELIGDRTQNTVRYVIELVPFTGG